MSKLSARSGRAGSVCHVEGLHGRGIAMDHHRLVELLGNERFLVAAEIVAPLRRVAGLLQNFDGFVVGDARKRRHDLREFATSRPSVASSRARFCTHALHHGADEAFAERHHVFQMRVRCFGLEHPEFGEMAARLRFFRAERWAECIDLAKRGGRCFDVELAGLREIGFLVVDVIHFEKRGGAFARSGRENRRVGERVALRIHEIARGANGFRTNPQNGGLARRANPEMPVVEKKIDAVLFELNRIGLGVRRRAARLRFR